MGEIVKCPRCQTEFDEDIEWCPSCRKYRVLTIHDSIRALDCIRVRGMREGERRPFVEHIQGFRADKYRPGNFIYETRTIQRDVVGGKYYHRVEKMDARGKPTGEPLHEERETLKEHNEKKRKREL